jgi:hypothetical protein
MRLRGTAVACVVLVKPTAERFRADARWAELRIGYAIIVSALRASQTQLKERR